MIITCKRCKGTGKITKKVSMNITHYGTCPQCKGEGKWEILGLKENEEVSKVEKVRVIRKLEELDGLENGMGLSIKVSDVLDTSAYRNLSVIFCDAEDVPMCSYFIENGKIKKTLIKQLKSCGFKFEYKPLRTKEEVLNDIEVSAREFSDIFDCVVAFQEGRWIDVEIQNDSLPARKYLTPYAAKALADELNEIIKNS